MQEQLDSLLQLRILVLTLGESHNAGWWNSQFLSDVGLSYLERIYPRTRFAAAVESAMKGAKLVHDSYIGKGEVFHLFRLLPNQEWEINKYLLDNSSLLESQYLPHLMDRATLLKKLGDFGGDLPLISETGPVQIPDKSSNRIEAIATAYYSAFSNDRQVYPYFEESKPIV